MTEQSLTHVALPPSLTGRTVLPSDARYERVRHGYVHRGAPAMVIFPESVEETAVALAYARSRGTVVSVRSGGHGISGRSTNDGGVVVDVSRLDDVAVLDRTRRRVRIGAGARWGESRSSSPRTGSPSAPETPAAWAWAGWSPRAAWAGSRGGTG